MNWDYIICHYAEIGLKGKNRRFFENKLKENIKTALKIHSPDSFDYVKRIHNRILIGMTSRGWESINEITSALRNTFGIAYFVFARKSKQEMDVLKKDSLDLLSQRTFDSFRITARSGDRSIPLRARKVNEEIGTYIIKHLGKTVNLGNPDISCFIDLVQDYAFVYLEKIAGRGGLPVGISGKVLSMISGGIDSPVASYYAMKRGAYVVYLHFHSVPYTSRASIGKVREVVEVLTKFQPRAKLYLVEFVPIQKAIMLETEPRFRIILYRRFMLRIAESVMKKEKAHAIITGESLGQVASQTLENMEVIESVTSIPVLRPLIGFDKQEIVDKAKEIDTYEISIQPDQDCCSLFVPKRPATRARLNDVERTEQVLDVFSLVTSAVENIEEEEISSDKIELI